RDGPRTLRRAASATPGPSLQHHVSRRRAGRRPILAAYSPRQPDFAGGGTLGASVAGGAAERDAAAGPGTGAEPRAESVDGRDLPGRPRAPLLCSLPLD